MPDDFVWRDAGRTVVFGRDALDGAPALLEEHRFANFTLLTTRRALAEATNLAAAADAVLEVPPGPVPDAAAALLDSVGSEPLVAHGGGRAIDTAKALAAVVGGPVAAIPTTMSGAEMTAVHRLPGGAEARARGLVRPDLVLADPEVMTSAPEAALRASSMNALAHAADCLYTPLANPVSSSLSLRAAGLIAGALDEAAANRDRRRLALGSLLAGYGIDSAHFGLHHVACQSLVAICGTPHAATNAAVLPHALEVLASRAPRILGELAAALGVGVEGLRDRAFELGGRPPALSDLGADPGCRGAAIEAMLARSELGFVPGPPLDAAELGALLDAAW